MLIPFPVQSQNIVQTANQNYYPGNVLQLELTNLTIQEEYSILIGANQLIIDQQWRNFTATAIKMTIEIIHFDKQSFLDNQSIEIDRLLINFYYHDSLIEQTYFRVKLHSETIDFSKYIPSFIALLIFLFALFISYLIIKYWIIKK